jgi:hypothetical protein
MSTAVQLTMPEGNSFDGILVGNPKVGQDCRLTLSDQSLFRILKVKGWLGLAGSNHVILFDFYGRRFRMQKIASSNEFLT